MRTISRLVVTVVGALVAIALTVGFASTASATPVESPEPIAASSEPAPQVNFICLPPGDTIETRSAIGAALGAIVGGIAGLPLFFIGAIPGAVIGGLVGVLIGSSSHAIDAGRLGC